MSKAKYIYIAGPMTGLPEHNFPAFNKAEEKLSEVGWYVVNPARNFDGRTDLPRESYIRADVALLVHCDAMAVLPGWQDSRGARLEYLLARELNMPVLDIQTLQPLANAPSATAVLDPHTPRDDSILDEAKCITAGVRQNDYGHPVEDFDRTARMWNGILAAKLRDHTQITAADVPLCMIAVKLAREAHRHKRDNLVDIAGYACTAAMIAGDE